MADKQNVWLWTKTLAAVGFVWAIIGYIWHGLLGQPSLINLMYPGFWSNPTLLLLGLICMVAGGAFTGWLFANIWNRLARK